MAFVIIVCWLTALLVPMWMLVASKLSSRWKSTWLNTAAATAIAAAVMMGLFTGAVLMLVDGKAERIISMIGGLLICLCEQAVQIMNAIQDIYPSDFTVRWPVLKGTAITVLVLMALAFSTCAAAALDL